MNAIRLRRGDYVVLLLATVTALVCAIRIWWPRAVGQTVVVTTPCGEQQYSLSQITTFTVEGNNDIILSVEIDNGRVRVLNSRCPDQVCVHSGWLSKAGQTAACVPAGVSLRVVGGSQEIDGVAS